MAFIPIDEADIAGARALRTEFARFWSTEQGLPRDVYDRFISATPTAAAVVVDQVMDGPAPGVWVRPAQARSGGAVLFLHGGGYRQGSARAYVGLVSQLAVRLHVPVFALDYPLAPESQLPEALNLAVAALGRLVDTHTAVAVVGDSAGGGLSLATVADAHRQNVDAVAVAVFSPWTDLTLSGPSVHEFAIGDPLLDPEYLRDCATDYLGSAAPDDPRAFPLFGAPDALPPMLIQVGTDEILLDDSRRLAEAIEKAGGAVTLEVWQGLHHVFQLNVAELASARRALDTAAKFLSAHLFGMDAAIS